MPNSALAFFLVAILAAIIGFGDPTVPVAQVFQILFFVSLAAVASCLVMTRRRPSSPKAPL